MALRPRTFYLQLLLLLVLPLTALLLAVGYGGLELHRQAMRQMVGERDERAARAAATAISEQLYHRASAVRGLAAAAADPARAIVESAYLRPDFDRGLAILDEDGALRAAAPDATWYAQLTVVEAIRAATDPSGAPAFSPAFADPWGPGQVMLAVAAAPSGGVAVGAFDPAALSREAITGLFDTGEDASAFVVDGLGRLLYVVGAPPHHGGDPSDHVGVAAALRGESGTTYLGRGDEEHVVAFSPVPAVGWALVMEEPWHSVADPMLRRTELIPFVLIPVLAMAMVGLWLGARQIVRPLQALEQQATALGRGQYEAIESPVGGIGEIRSLQAEMTQMARQLRAAQDTLRGYLDAVTVGQEEERRRLARELHDDTIQSLIALNQRIQLAEMNAPDEPLRGRLAEMQGMVEQTIGDLRRVTRDLRPIYLEDLGLSPALQMLARDAAASHDIPIDYTLEGEERRLPAATELAFYRIAQEALSNIARHAHAERAGVTLSFGPAAATLTIVDDGAGFDVPENLNALAAAGHYGLLGMQERAQAVGARLTLDSAPGRGTSLTVETRPAPGG